MPPRITSKRVAQDDLSEVPTLKKSRTSRLGDASKSRVLSGKHAPSTLTSNGDANINGVPTKKATAGVRYMWEEDENEEAEFEEAMRFIKEERLHPSIQIRLDFIRDNISDVNNQFYDKIIDRLYRYKGARTGDTVPDDIYKHCAKLAKRDLDLKDEKMLIRDFRKISLRIPLCDEVEFEDTFEEDHRYTVPTDVEKRKTRCEKILDKLSVKYLNLAMESLPLYFGPKEGGRMKLSVAIVEHLDQLASSRMHADLVAEETMFQELLGKMKKDPDEHRIY